MLYFKFHIGDWITGTRLCSPFERGIYIDLLTLYYSKERPLMREECERIASAYAPEMRKAFDYVLENFFEREGDTYRHHRADKEIAECLAVSSNNRRAAKARWEKEKTEGAQQGADDTQNERKANADANAYANADAGANANAMPTINHKPINTPKGVCVGADKPRTATRKNAPLDFYGLPGDLSADWVRSRGSKKLTQTAINGVKREAEKAGVTFEQAVRMMLENGWQGFKASWDSVKDRAAELPFEDKTPEEVRAYEEQVAQAYGAPATPVDGEDMLGAMKGTFAGEFADDRAA
jgi:uncharacterized protein YdaU (DUF1376 family)